MKAVDVNGKTTERSFGETTPDGTHLEHIVLDARDCFDIATLVASDPQLLQERLRELGTRMSGGDRYVVDAGRIELQQECAGYPESYMAKLDGRQVGYLRMRWGHFTVDVPDYGEKTVLSAWPEGHGEFMDDERDHYLQMAREAIAIEIARSRPTENTPSM